MNEDLKVEKKSKKSSYVISYLSLRRAVGILGLMLPFVLLFGVILITGEKPQSTISHYYHTKMGGVFVGTLCAIGVFLLSYRGPERSDDIAGDLACLFAVGVALFPTIKELPMSNTGGIDPILVVGGIHAISAVLLFSTLAYFSLVQFVKTDSPEEPGSRKTLRNVIYKICGWTIVTAIVLIGIYYVTYYGAIKFHLMPDTIQKILDDSNVVFWLETIAVLGFAVSWLVKGEAILRDL